MKLLFIGDIVGSPGRKIAKEIIPQIKREKSIDICIANCENAAGGSGITYNVANELLKSGIDVITLGNHTWAKMEIINYIDSEPRILRPANYPKELPGQGSTIYSNNRFKIGVVNVLGRIYMDSFGCPFRTAVEEIENLKKYVNIVVVDFHAEATSEKCALGWYLDGKASCVLGTHTHIQTADERILPQGTGYITDVGMTGPHDGIIGVEKEKVIEKFLTHLPIRFEVAKGDVQFNAVVLEIDEKTGMTLNIERINKVVQG